MLSSLVAAATVAIEVPPEAPIPAVERVVESCQSVLGPDACVPVGTPALFVAVVTWDGQTLKIALGAPDEPRIVVARTQIDFSPLDDEAERWVTTGLMVAALTAAQPKELPPAAPPPAGPLLAGSPPPGVVAPAPEPEPAPASTSHVVIDLGALLGQGLDGGPLRAGVGLRATLAPKGSPIGVTVGGRGTGRGGEPALAWRSGSIGVAWRVTPWTSRSALELFGGAVLQSALARATRDGEERIARSLRGGGRVGATAGLGLGRGMAAWAGADATYMRPALEVRLDSQSVGREGPLRWALGAGLRFERPSRP